MAYSLDTELTDSDYGYLYTRRVTLRGLPVKEAKRVVFDYIQDYEACGLDAIFFITGLGNTPNSDGSRGVIRKNFPKWLKDPTIANLIKDYKYKTGTYEVFFKKIDNNEDADVINSIDVGELLKKAENGDAESQYIVGKMYAFGWGKLDQSNKEAVKWIKRGAENNCIKAQIFLGEIYYNGKYGVKSDRNETIRWNSKASELGSADACWNLASLYHICYEDEKAKDFYRKAAMAGHIRAANFLGCIYSEEKNHEEATVWLRKAAEAGYLLGKGNLGKILIFDYQGSIEEGLKWLNEAAESDFATSQFWLGLAYVLGNRIKENYEKGFKWLLKSAQKGAEESIKARFVLAGMYLTGKGVDQNENEGMEWLKKAVEDDHYMAKIKLGDIYRYGYYNITKNYEEALKWYKEAAENEDIESRDSGPLKLDFFVSTKIYETSRLNDETNAEFILAEIYKKGLLDVGKDETQAREWEEKAVNRGLSKSNCAPT